MTTNKAATIYLSLAIALVLGSAQLQAQTDETGLIPDAEVQVQTIQEEAAVEAIQEETVEAIQEETTVIVEEQEALVVEEEAAQETEIAQEQEQEEVTHDAEMDAEVARHKAEMAAYLRSKGITPPQ